MKRRTTMKLTKLENDFLDWIADNGTEAVARAVTDRKPRAVAAWLNSIDPHTGHIEIAGQYSRTGNPVVGYFPELAADLYPFTFNSVGL